MAYVLYTIGYAGYAIDAFRSEINAQGISTVIDVRSNPYSQYHADYNKEALEAYLKRGGIHYRNYAREFGAQQTNKAFYAPGGYLDFEKFAQSEAFQSGVEKLAAGMEKGYSMALMCAEKDPFNCHRTILVARAFHQRGFVIVHLLPDGITQSQEEIDMRLLERFFPNRNQLTFFDEDNASEADMIRQAYQKRNAEIGYATEQSDDDDLYNRLYPKNGATVL